VIDKKIGLIIPSLSSGGIEMYLLRFLNFIKSTEQITIIVRSNQKGELYEDYKKTEVNLIFMPLGYANPKRALNYYRFFRKMQFDVVCDFNANFAGSSLFLANLAGVNKRIAFYRQGNNHFKPSVIKNLINNIHNKLVYKYATHILANSHSGIDFFFPFRKETDKRFKVLYNGVDVNKYQLKETKHDIRKEIGISQNAFVIGHVGRYDQTKNHKTILKVAKHLITKDSSYVLVLCGRNTEQLQSEIDNLNINDNVLILGYRKDVPRVLKALDCFYFPSLTEGQPNALIEAMLSNLPIACSNIKPILECIPKELHTNTFDPLDFKKQIKVIRMITNSKKRYSSKNHAEVLFDANQQFAKFENLLNE
jgi:glycosyltransferase involved in cell wall biosynthesis